MIVQRSTSEAINKHKGNTMAKLAVATGAAFLGYAMGGPTGAKIGWMVGSAAGAYLFPGKLSDQIGPRLDDLRVTSSTYGADIPTVYGTFRINGNIIWSSGLIETSHANTVGGKGGPSASQTTVTYTYSASWAVGLCEGEVFDVNKIWADGKLIYDTQTDPAFSGGITIYKGDETQIPDSTIEAYEGAGNVPAHRGLCYIVFVDAQLASFGNRIPNIIVEVAKTENPEPLADVIQDISQRCGLPATDVSTSAIVDNVAGYVRTRQMQGRAVLEPLLEAYSISGVESDWLIRYTHVSSATVVDIPDNADLVPHLASGEEQPDKILVSRSQDTDLPQKVSVGYAQSGKDYSIGYKVVQRHKG